MTKKLISIILAVLLILPFSTYVYAEENTEFIKVSIAYPEGEELFATDYQSYSRIMARYADNKTPIALSDYYDGYVWVSIPKENEGREIEVYIADEVSFPDDDDSFEFYTMEKMGERGVIQGNHEGYANPLSNLTRAEAAAMVMRTLGIDTSDTKTPFTDVKEDEWYAGVINAAYKYGLVKGVSETKFSPKRVVTRAEATVMVARAIWIAGFGKENVSATTEQIRSSLNFYDVDKVEGWALSAYDALDTYNVFDTIFADELGIETSDGVLYNLSPNKVATRYDIANMLYRVCENYQVYPSQNAIKYGFDKQMPIIDGSTSTYPFTQNLYSQLFANGYRHPDRPEAHSKSHVSYQRLINGEIDMMFASVYPASDILKMAEEKGVELELIPIAYDAMIFFTNADNSIEGLTKEQISNIYVNNAYSNWNELGGPDALLYPYCRNNDSGSHAQMEKHFLNGNEIHETIRTESTSVAMANVLTDVMGAKTDDPVGYGLGYSIYYYFNNMDLFYDTNTLLKLLAIDGVAPNDDTIADGSYPLSNNTYIVLRKNEPEGSPARKMAEFMLTEAGQYVVELAGFGPLKK